ncbi:MAG TPA: hypothetical protein VEI25_03405, partial [Paraburkholderia sp.]|nr:hypothetical protein [Paraburkholderia sp.]
DDRPRSAEVATDVQPSADGDQGKNATEQIHMSRLSRFLRRMRIRAAHSVTYIQSTTVTATEAAGFYSGHRPMALARATALKTLTVLRHP